MRAGQDSPHYTTIQPSPVMKLVIISLGAGVTADDFIMFSKNKAVNNSSLLGYYAEVKLSNDSTDKVELFSIGSEVTQSSK